jgi:paired small multidrug resistance pump
MDFINKWLINSELLIAGLIGAVVAIPFQQDLKSRSSLIIFIVTGAACAHYLTGMVAYYFDIEPSSAGGVGFLLGAFGGSFIAAIIKMMQSADIWSIIKSRLGGK